MDVLSTSGSSSVAEKMREVSVLLLPVFVFVRKVWSWFGRKAVAVEADSKTTDRVAAETFILGKDICV